MISEFNGDFLQWLRGFYYTAQTGSMSAATHIMNRNQSALTHQIKSIEEELGVKVFRGTKANRELTEEGRYLLSRTVQIFEIINELKDNIGRAPDELEGEISIVAVFSALQSYMPSIVTSFNQQYPNVRFFLYGESQRDLLYEKLISRKVDLGIISASAVPDELVFEPLFKAELVLLAPKTGPYAISGPIFLEQIIEMPFIAPPSRSTLGMFLEHQFSRYGLSLRITHMVEHQEALKECVANGMGISIMDDMVCTQEMNPNLNVVPLCAFLKPRIYGILRRRDLFMSSLLKVFISCMHQNSNLAENTDSPEKQ